MLIAWKNIMARKWSSAKVVLSILAMVVIMCIFTAYSVALGDETERITKSYRSAHNIIIETTLPLSNQKLQQVKNIDGISNVAEVAICRNVKNLRGISIDIDGKNCVCDHDYYDGNLQIGIDPYVNNLHYGDFAFVGNNQKIVQPHHEEELDFRFKGDKCLLLGKDSVSDNEIIVSEYFLQEFELDGTILNKTLNLIIGGDSYSFTVVGIMNMHFYELTNTIDQHFIANNNSALFQDYFLKNNKANIKYQTKLYLKEAKLDDKIVDSVRDLKIFNLKSISLGSHYGLSMATTVKIISSILNGIMATVGLGIIGALVLNILYSMQFMMKKKNNFYAIMQVYGMDKQKLFTTMFCEMFILSMFAAVIAYCLNYGLVFLLDYLLSSMVGVGVFFGWANFLITFAIAVIFTLGVVALVCLINYSMLFKRSTIKMLKNSMEN